MQEIKWIGSKVMVQQVKTTPTLSHFSLGKISSPFFWHDKDVEHARMTSKLEITSILLDTRVLDIIQLP